MYQVSNSNQPIGEGIYPMSHFYTNSPNPPSSHPMDEAIIKAEELFYKVFRLKYGEAAKTKRGSGFRTTSDPDYSPSSQHSLGKARDCNWADQSVEKEIVAIVCYDILTQGAIFQALWQLGFRGFGRYETFFHIDTRNNADGSGTYNGQRYNQWSQRPNYNYDAQQHQVFFAQYPQAYSILGSALKGNKKKIVNGGIVSDAVMYVGAGLKGMFSPNKEDGYTHIDPKQQLISYLTLIAVLYGIYWLYENRLLVANAINSPANINF